MYEPIVILEIVMEFFQRVKVWWVNLLYPSIPYPDIPDHYLSIIDSLESYRSMVIYLFDDGYINAGRIEILDHFTKRLCLRLPPDVASDIQSHFQNVIRIWELAKINTVNE